MTSTTAIKGIPGGRVWVPSALFAHGWDSECGNFRIVPWKPEGVLLMAFRHADPTGRGRFWTKVLPTVEDAILHAECM